MGAPLADPARLGTWLGLGALADADLERAEEVVGTISDLVRGEARQLAWDLDTVPADISAIVLMVSVECWTNPDNKQSVTIEEITRRWNTGQLFSPAQLFTIRAKRPGQASGIGTVQTTRGYGYPSIAVPDGPRPGQMRPSADAVTAPVDGGKPVSLYDGRGY